LFGVLGASCARRGWILAVGSAADGRDVVGGFDWVGLFFGFIYLGYLAGLLGLDFGRYLAVAFSTIFFRRESWLFTSRLGWLILGSSV
jgi:hypothetical protein